VPGAFNKIKPTKTAPGASETVKILKITKTTPGADETVEIQEDPSKQLQLELVVRMATTPIPKPKEANLIKLVQFDILNLTKQNIRTWKLDIQEFYKI
jgi:hypothetical protein